MFNKITDSLGKPSPKATECLLEEEIQFSLLSLGLTSPAACELLKLALGLFEMFVELALFLINHQADR
jgi:hypothetical protein